MATVKTVSEVWGGDEPLETKYGPTHYVMVRFHEDPEKTASLGVKPPNFHRARQTLLELIDVAAEFTLELNDKGNYRIRDYAGKHGSELKVVGESGVARNSSPQVRSSPTTTSAPTPPIALPTDDQFFTLVELLNGIEEKVDRLLEGSATSRSAEDIIKDVLGAEREGPDIPVDE